MLTGTLSPPDTLSRPIWQLHMFYLLSPIFVLNMLLFSGHCYSNIPRYFRDFAFDKLIFQVQRNDNLNQLVMKYKFNIQCTGIS